MLGLTSFLPMLHWAGVYVGALPWAALSVLEALYVALLGAVLAVATRRGTAGWRAVALPPVVGGLWVAQEALRDRTPFGGFPWGRLAFSQEDSPLLRLAALGGAPLITFAVATAGERSPSACSACSAGACPPARPGCGSAPGARRSRARCWRPARWSPPVCSCRCQPVRTPAGAASGWPACRATCRRPGSSSTPSGARCSTTTPAAPSTSHSGSPPAPPSSPTS
ncbi:hypothetical protein GCM10025868_45590 [Angustibacter aerolatus]|uniref:Apolipoprotein N-acyltransferase N-terminal domain-containing protein n=1 Tax=Angustibacter aerolatus TaxID=1162965 RepID=A0ABQ6JN02_9ACTN|nr:hypothetical protein GCM10025868_45590 [Angustibacter aerolatus]